jgi:hypothetical protein
MARPSLKPQEDDREANLIHYSVILQQFQYADLITVPRVRPEYELEASSFKGGNAPTPLRVQ